MLPTAGKVLLGNVLLGRLCKNSAAAPAAKAPPAIPLSESKVRALAALPPKSTFASVGKSRYLFASRLDARPPPVGSVPFEGSVPVRGRVPEPGRVPGKLAMFDPPGRVFKLEPDSGRGVGKLPYIGREFAIRAPAVGLPPLGRRLMLAGTDGRESAGVRAAAPP
jgi:hypothetical protein